MRKSSFTLAILLISVMVIGIVDGQPTVTGYITEGNTHFANGELGQAWDAFKMAENLAIANDDFNGQLGVVIERLRCGAATTDPHYQGTFGDEAYDLYEKLLQSAIEKTRDPATFDQGQAELNALAAIVIPNGPFGSRDRILASQRDAIAALAALVRPTSPPAASTGCSWTGTWGTNWNDMILLQSGNQVTGSYSYNSGTITGTVIGNTLSGRWDETPNGPKTKHYSGDFIFFMDDSCNGFTSKYNHDDDPDWKTNWTGWRK